MSVSGLPRREQLVIVAVGIPPAALRGLLPRAVALNDSPLAVDERLQVGTAPAEHVRRVLQQVALPLRGGAQACDGMISIRQRSSASPTFECVIVAFLQHHHADGVMQQS